ncbi:MAG: ORF6N domain-containing protein [Bacteroidota bacterium]
MSTENSILISRKIHELRGRKVMMDFDLAELFGIPTKVFNQSVRRNSARFPEDFMFQLSSDEWENLRSQIVTSSWGGIRHKPHAFTEQGVAMLSSILNSDSAIKMNISIIRTFIHLRHVSMAHQDLQSRIASLEKKYDQRFESIEQALDFLIDQKAAEVLQENRKMIGFGK